MDHNKKKERKATQVREVKDERLKSNNRLLLMDERAGLSNSLDLYGCRVHAGTRTPTRANVKPHPAQKEDTHLIFMILSHIRMHTRNSFPPVGSDYASALTGWASFIWSRVCSLLRASDNSERT